MLRTDFSNLADSKAAHIADHTALHLRYNGMASVDKPGTAAENAAAINAAIAQATIDGGGIAQLGGTVLIGPGDYTLTDTIEIRQTWGLRFVGCGYATRFIWRGPADKPMFRLAHCREVEFGNMFMSFPQAASAGIELVRDDLPGSVIVPTHNMFHHIWIDGRNCLARGFAVTGIDANNDFHNFEHCEVVNYLQSAWYLPNSQNYGNRMIDCVAGGNGTSSQYGVEAFGSSGNYHWSGGSAGGHMIADFTCGMSVQPFIIEFVNSENSKRFLASEYANTIRVVGCRYAANKLHSDGRAIMLTGWPFYQITLEDCSFGDGPTNTLPLTMFFQADDAAYASSGIVVRNCMVYSAAASVWSARTPHVVETSTWKTDEKALASKRLV